jgi:2-polyprenyl-3-methyl-5-hydroxy-6-metoxy-1,4-benzoquinol methylase
MHVERIADAERWNHNLHYSSIVLDAIPTGTQSALDVGCGEGTLTRAIRRVVPRVTGIDADAPSIEGARAQNEPSAHIDYVLGDVLTHAFDAESFDVVVAVAALHHMDAEAGLLRMQHLLAPGGVLVVVGCARSVLPRDVGWEAAAIMASRWHRLRREYWEHTAPTVWPPPVTHGEMRRLAQRHLPGARYRRHVLWRYAILWTKPA